MKKIASCAPHGPRASERSDGAKETISGFLSTSLSVEDVGPPSGRAFALLPTPRKNWTLCDRPFAKNDGGATRGQTGTNFSRKFGRGSRRRSTELGVFGFELVKHLRQQIYVFAARLSGLPFVSADGEAVGWLINLCWRLSDAGKRGRH
jgi:hypothetical protein